MRFYFFFVFMILAGCASFAPYSPNAKAIDSSSLPLPDIFVSIPNLSPCTDSNDKGIAFSSTSSISVLVHGCKGSAGRFRSLAQLYAFHGEQAVCYSYDDRESLVDNARKLTVAIGQLAKYTGNQSISVVGHSMGGLISRKALEDSDQTSQLLDNKNIELITISAPFSGIQAASHCANKALNWLSLGTVPAICWLITGNNWYEITSSSEFIQRPQSLTPSVTKYLKIVTDEKGTCRRQSNEGRCIESDYVFSLSEQYHPVVDSYPNILDVKVNAGHVEIVGNKDIVPRKLLSVLQENGVLSNTPVDRANALEQLLSTLY